MIGIDFNSQKLHCMIVMNDEIGANFTKPGLTFFRGFVTEDRDTGAITARMRFRHGDGDSWNQFGLTTEYRQRSKVDQVQYFVAAIVATMRIGLSVFAGGAPVPKDAVAAYYPPNPDDAEGTLEWLIAKDLMEIKTVIKNGQQIPVQPGPEGIV